MSWFYTLYEEVERNAKYRISLQKGYLYLFNEQSSGLLFLPCCLLVFLVTLPSKDQIFLSPHNLAICVQLTTTFSLLTSCQWEPIYSKNEKPWHIMRIPWKKHEKQLETMKNHLQLTTILALLTSGEWKNIYSFFKTSFLFLQLKRYKIALLFQVSPYKTIFVNFMCALDNHIFLPYNLSMGNHIQSLLYLQLPRL